MERRIRQPLFGEGENVKLQKPLKTQDRTNDPIGSPKSDKRPHLEDPSQTNNHTWKTQVRTNVITGVEVPRRRIKNNYPDQEGFYQDVSQEG